MTTPAEYLLYNGKPTPTPDPVELKAGLVSLQYDNGSLRYIRLGETELVRQIYSAVRDQNWATIPGRLENLSIETQDGGFEIRFESVHQQNDIDFRWQGHITGSADGTVRFHMDGEAHSQFKRNRIGFCILHPMDAAGLPLRIVQVDGDTVEGQFPVEIMPHQPYFDIRAVQHEYMPGNWVEVRMEGDTFEMEDQRNWIDASYKTYCTPLSKPFPVMVTPGTKIEQTITLSLLQTPESSDSAGSGSLVLTPDPSQSVPLPPIGLGMASHGEALSDSAISRLHHLNLSHLRADLHLHGDWRESLQRLADTAERLGVPLELALHLGEDAEAALESLKAAVEGVPVTRYLIFRKGELATGAPWTSLARRILGTETPVVGGSDAFFTQVNRNRPEPDAIDGVVYSLNPQVHAFDDASLVETLATQAATIDSAQHFTGGKPVHVGPITFKMRWNPDATAPQVPPGPGELPHQADSRQMSLFGAGWTLGSIKYVALGGAASATYYETTGYMGVMPTEQESVKPEVFWYIPGGVYPMYHVFADVNVFKNGQLFALNSGDRLRVDGCGLRLGSQTRYLIANLSPHTQEIALQVDSAFSMTVLDAESVEDAMRSPEGYRAQVGRPVQAENGALHLTLPPFAVVTLDASA